MINTTWIVETFPSLTGSGLGAALAAWGALAQEPPPPPQLSPRSSALATAPDWSQLQALSKTLTAEEFDAAIETFYRDERRLPAALAKGCQWRNHPHRQARWQQSRIGSVRRDAPEAQPPRYWRKAVELPKLEGRPVLSDCEDCARPRAHRWRLCDDRRAAAHLSS